MNVKDADIRSPKTLAFIVGSAPMLIVSVWSQRLLKVATIQPFCSYLLSASVHQVCRHTDWGRCTGQERSHDLPHIAYKQRNWCVHGTAEQGRQC